MKQSKTLFFLFSFALVFFELAFASQLEDAYNKYRQGDYEGANQILESLLQQKPDAKDMYQMKEALGFKALLEMSQNQRLKSNIQLVQAYSWKYGRKQFKNPRRIAYYIRSFLEDDTTRHKSLPNLLAAGQYAVPGLVQYLKSDQDQLSKSSLAFQALVRMGREAVPPLCATTFSKDPLLLSRIVRILSQIGDKRSIPYLLRLQRNQSSPIILEEIKLALAKPNLQAKEDFCRSFIREACRYAKLDYGVAFEGMASDGLLWVWNSQKEILENPNELKQNFEFRPSYPNKLWHLFKANLMISELTQIELNQNEWEAANACKLAIWASLENLSQQLLKDEKVSPDLKKKLSRFIKFKTQKLELAYSLGVQTYLQALQLSLTTFPTSTSARLIKIISNYNTKNILNFAIHSYLDPKSDHTLSPLQQALLSPNDLVRYRAAIAITKSHPSLDVPDKHLIFGLLMDAMNSIDEKTVLLVSEKNQNSEKMQTMLEDLGYFVYAETTGPAALASLHQFPVKNIILLHPNLKGDMSSLDFINRLQSSTSTKNIPLGILSSDDQKEAHRVMFEDYAGQLLLAEESPNLIKEKLLYLESTQNQKLSVSMSQPISYEALQALQLLNLEVLLTINNSLVQQLSHVLEAGKHREASLLLTLDLLSKFEDQASFAIPMLLKKLAASETSEEYHRAILKSFLSIAKSNPKVRSLMIKDLRSNHLSFETRKLIATYLSREQFDMNINEKNEFQKLFFNQMHSVKQQN